MLGNGTFQGEQLGLLSKLKDAVQVKALSGLLRHIQFIARNEKRRVFGKAGGFYLNHLLIALGIKGANVKAQSIA